MNIQWNEVTWYSRLGALVVFVFIVPVITFYFGFSYGELRGMGYTSNTVEDATKPAASVPSSAHLDTTSYDDPETGLHMDYPSKWMKSGASNNLSFAIPYAIPKPNSLTDLGVSVSITPGTCLMPTDFNSAPASSATFNNITFLHGQSDDAAMMHRYSKEYYGVTRNGSCYSFIYSSAFITPEMATESDQTSGINDVDAYAIASNNTLIMNAARDGFTHLMQSVSFIDSPQGVNEADATTFSLTRIMPNRVHIGATISLDGDTEQFDGHDTLVWIVKAGPGSTGKEKAVLWGGMVTVGNDMNIPVPTKACTVYTGGSGAPCPWYMTLQPGDYKLYVQNQNGRSNSLPFTIF